MIGKGFSGTATTATLQQLQPFHYTKIKKELFGCIKKYVYLCTHESSDTTS